MNGRAPKSSLTGSHICLIRNLKPNLLMDKRDCVTSSNTIKATIASTATAQSTTTERKAESANTLSRDPTRLLDTTLSPCPALVSLVCFISGSSELDGRGSGMVRMYGSYQLIVKALLKIECRSIKPALRGVTSDSRSYCDARRKSKLYFWACFLTTLTSLIRAFTFTATLFGRGAYSRAVVMVWPLSTIQFRKSTKALYLPASLHSAGTSSQVKLLMG